MKFKLLNKRAVVLVCTLLICHILQAQFLKQKGELQKYEGYFDFHYSQKEDKIYLEVDKLDAEFLYVYSLASGVGSNDIGLDRGQIGDGVIVKFERAGNKLLLIQPNQRYRANTDNTLEKKSIEQAFAKSVLFGFKILEEKNNTFVIDFTPFLMQDAHGVADRLQQRGQGNYSIDASKSALSLEKTKAFPKNVEFEALLTFKGKPKGYNIRSVTPNAKLVSVITHHSFVELPDNKYQKREFDPRSGALFISYLDYATPVQEPIVKRYITRHRLEKKNPNEVVSEAKEPIVYYLDPGTPEPVRSALLEGGAWWNQAYEAIGFKDAFQIKMLPEDADPMDLRYNVIQWVHRSTRGWSYGASVIDPRTGEILKGHVSLGSLRIRQDFLIAQALLNKPFAKSDTNYQPMLEMALARIRQLSAHEIGHTIGFAHNFAASAHGRASVMDYPHPLVQLKNNKIELSDAYDDKIGAWDKVSVAYSYSDFGKKGNEKAALNRILDDAYKAGMRFITDSDARPRGGANAIAHLWDNGTNASEELNRLLKVRSHAITNFSQDNIRSNETYSTLEDVFVPLYFFHRYQTEAAIKLIGGLNYNYATKGSQQEIVSIVDQKQQKEALEAVLNTLKAETLAIPKEKLSLFPPRAYGYSRSRESFKGVTGVGFDALSAAATASEMTLGLLLHPERASRLIQQKSMDTKQLDLITVIDELLKTSFKQSYKDAYLNEVRHAINTNVLKYLMNLATQENSYAQVRAIANYKINELAQWLKSNKGEGVNEIYTTYYINQIKTFEKKPEDFKLKRSPKIPDGSPIGSGVCELNN